MRDAEPEPAQQRVQKAGFTGGIEQAGQIAQAAGREFVEVSKLAEIGFHIPGFQKEVLEPLGVALRDDLKQCVGLPGREWKNTTGESAFED